ncbi:MAG: hypothetical protein LVQ75_04770 [Candidatus Babeliales bacterium]
MKKLIYLLFFLSLQGLSLAMEKQDPFERYLEEALKDGEISDEEFAGLFGDFFTPAAAAPAPAAAASPQVIFSIST